MRLLATEGFRRVFPVLVSFTILAGDAWRYSIGWWGFGVLAVLLVAASVLLLVHERDRWSFGALPYPLVVFVALTIVSIAWSFYPGATALGVLTTLMTVTIGVAVAVAFSWAEILRALGTALRVIVGLSLLFELVVAVFVRAPVLPLIPAPGIDYASYEKIPKLLYWSRNELFEVFDGGKIQGIVGNSSLLAMVALLALIVFCVQFAGERAGRGWTALWILAAAATVAFTRSATITLGIVAVLIVLAAVLLVRRAPSARARTITYWTMLGVTAAAVVVVIVFRDHVLALLGKSPDLTNRTDIWNSVIELAQQRPVAGWGWVSYWVPWVAPFDTLAFNNGVRQLHAHNAWLDIWMQLGILGLLAFGALVISSALRSWAFATDRPLDTHGRPLPYAAVSVAPLLVLTALLVQSLAESRLIVEYGLFLLTLIAVKTKSVRDRGIDADAP